jgi:hypothetical protein
MQLGPLLTGGYKLANDGRNTRSIQHSWAQVDHIDGPLHGARAGSVQGFLERLTRPSRYTHLAALALQSLSRIRWRGYQALRLPP